MLQDRLHHGFEIGARGETMQAHTVGHPCRRAQHQGTDRGELNRGNAEAAARRRELRRHQCERVERAAMVELFAIFPAAEDGA